MKILPQCHEQLMATIATNNLWLLLPLTKQKNDKTLCLQVCKSIIIV